MERRPISSFTPKTSPSADRPSRPCATSEQKFRQLAENISEVFWMMNIPGTEILYIGPAYARIWGRSCESLYANPLDWLDAVHPDDRESAHETFRRQVQGESIEAAYRIRTPDGQEKWIRDRAFLVRDDAGQPIRIVGVAEEVTQQKLAEEKLLETNRRLQDATNQLRIESARIIGDAELILASAGEGIYGLDAEGLTTFANPAALAMLGYAAEELIGKPQHAMIHHSHPDGSRFSPESCLIYKALRDGMVHRSDAEVFWKKDGTSFPISYTSTPHHAGWQAERRRRPVSRHLRTQAPREGRSRQPGQEPLPRQHEPRNPYPHERRHRYESAPCSKPTSPPSSAASSEIAQSSGRALLTLIDSILDISKIEAGKIALEKRDFDLAQTVEDVVQILRVQAREKGLHLSSLVSPQIPALLRGDPHRLRQVLTNLASNAIKFTGKGGVTVDVALQSQNDLAVTVRFSVTDTGIGIRPDQIGALFSPFVQADASTTRKYGGTGLGLAISKQLVEMMGGTIGIDSQEDKGSTFWFTAVFESVQTGPLHPLSQALGGASRSAMPIGHGERVLVVEDNPYQSVRDSRSAQKAWIHLPLRRQWCRCDRCAANWQLPARSDGLRNAGHGRL